jgi:hypothetical protein
MGAQVWRQTLDMAVTAVRKTSVPLLSLVLLLAVLVTGCSARPAAPTVKKSPSEAYLARPGIAGWSRGVGRNDGLVLVFETPSQLSDRADWPARFVLFNESGKDIHWDNARFGVEVTGSDKWISMTIGFPRGPAIPAAPLDLRAGEVTSREVDWEQVSFGEGVSAVQVSPSMRRAMNASSAVVTVPTMTVEVR